MKKTCFILLALFFTMHLCAQEIWIEAALKGGDGLSFLVNKNIINDNSYDYKLTNSYGLGAKVAVNFGPWHGVSLEAMYNNLGQDFDYYLAGTTGSLRNSIDWKSIDTYLLYRYIRNRMYVETGPVYGVVQPVSQTDNGVALSAPADFYEKSYLGGVFGFGGYIAASGTFSVGLGVRLQYGFTDFVNDAGQKAGYPNPVRQSIYDSPATTHPAFVQFMVEFNFGLGRFAPTSCGQRRQFLKGGGRR
jgi:hypothetical protein